MACIFRRTEIKLMDDILVGVTKGEIEMNKEEITKTTSYFNALRDVADAARKVEEIRVRYEDTVDRLMSEKREAEKELRAALERALALTDEPLPVSERDKEVRCREEYLRGLDRKSGKK